MYVANVFSHFDICTVTVPMVGFGSHLRVCFAMAKVYYELKFVSLLLHQDFE